jgi:hypothetical protein
MKKFLLLLLVFQNLCFTSFSQEINKHISYITIYDYLDELANMGVIELNSAVKPYSYKLIGEKLKEAETKQELLTKRQQKDLAFFLKDYNKLYDTDGHANFFGKEFSKDYDSSKHLKKRLDAFYYKDSLFMFTLNPILGYSSSSNKNGTAWHRWGGAEVNATIGKHFGFYFSLRDNSVKNILIGPTYLTQDQGGNLKPGSTNMADYDEARGGMTYGWKWGSISLIKDNFAWGNNYNGANIFSGRQPSFAYLNYKLKPAKWFEYNYIHGSLISGILDSSRTYGMGSSLRQDFIPKYMAANLATIRFTKKLFVSVGNSIVYADKYIQPIYLIPFMFYPSADHTQNGAGSNAVGENSQMFLDVSCRNIPKTHLYGTVFVDEINLSKIFKPHQQTNFLSFKAGVRFTNIIKNTAFTFEYTRTNPWVYVHPISSITFASNNYNMGNYLGQNSDELYGGIKIKPLRGLTLDAGLSWARKGEVLAYQQINGVNNNAGTPFMHNIQWQNKSLLLKAQYEIINDVFIFASCNYQQITGTTIGLETYSPAFYYGNTTTINGVRVPTSGNTMTLTGGLNWGF